MNKSFIVLALFLLVSIASCYKFRLEDSEHSHNTKEIPRFCIGQQPDTPEYRACERAGYYGHDETEDINRNHGHKSSVHGSVQRAYSTGNYFHGYTRRRIYYPYIHNEA